MDRYDRIHGLVFALVLYPILVGILAMAGFVCGVPVGGWHAPLALFGTLGAAFYVSEEKSQWSVIAWFLVSLAVSIVIAGLPMMYSNADAELYHRPAVVLFDRGWNPLRVTEIGELRSLAGGSINAWHVAFLPRLGWIFGAVLYKWVGFIEVADSLNFILLIASILYTRSWVKSTFIELGSVIGWIVTLGMCFSPVVIGGAFGGSVDSAGYSALLIAILSATRRDYKILVPATVIMSSLKFTGVIVSVLVFVVFGLDMVVGVLKERSDWREFRRIFIAGCASGVLILLANISPYITSWKNHGGPFYPSHSFVASERFEDSKNPITFDFGLMNADAKELGYFGRFAWGYVSQNAVKVYYRWKTGREDFNPVFHVSGGVGGLGPLFRILFVLSLICWPFIRNRSINLLLGLILLTVLVQPTFYSGYARYVPQFYLFPWLVGLSFLRRFKAIIIGLLCAFSLSVAIYPLSFLALQWIISVQNLQIIQAAREEKSRIYPFWSKSIYPNSAFSNDYGVRIERAEKDQGADGLICYSPYFDNYRIWLRKPIEGFYNLHHTVSGNDESIKANRNRENIRYFLREFLPREIVLSPIRFGQVALIRMKQIVRGIR